MTARSIRRDGEQGTLEGIRPGESLDDFERRVGDDVPELTDEDFARARSLSDFPELASALEKARGQRGKQRAPVKDRVGLRLDHAVVQYFRATGPGWQSRINDVLVDHVKHHSK